MSASATANADGQSARATVDLFVLKIVKKFDFAGRVTGVK